MAVFKATIEHVEEAAVLFDNYRMFYKQPSDLAGAIAFLAGRIENNESILFVAKDQTDNRAIGFTQLYPSFSSISMRASYILNDLYVLEAYRGQGAAQLLLDQAKEFARAANAKGLELSTAIENETAQRLYERNGYKRDNEYFHYYLTI
ncbi:GNAT family N-acetyltransferase [Paenibacillus sp. PL91]|uniref:GNAT family N-acetyltransferase n=1 Tax=Paenibacillus sp. PL91 TaxID=2729538 RepID=UPI00145D8903|nr:GNAT family N-acetyltransferase [Paenibacillus sp. PL91]MBC9199095.1 GNAT family N-acetyltransferase [Paenibacillus sp. PL91]